MAKVLIINGKKKFHHSAGQLNDRLTEVAENLLKKKDLDTKITVVDQGYDIEEEIEKFLWADLVIYQMPGWWMGAPWIVKKYIDEVFTHGHGKLYASDGRSRNDPSKKYGSGGLLPGKKFMLSVTWNAPVTAFEDKNDFFHGVGVEGVYLPFRKAHEFLGMSGLPTFMCNDVIKQPAIENDIRRYEQHLENILLKYF